MKKLLITLCMLFSVIAVSAQTRDLVSEFLNSNIAKQLNAVSVVEIDEIPEFRELPHPIGATHLLEDYITPAFSVWKAKADYHNLNPYDCLKRIGEISETSRVILFANTTRYNPTKDGIFLYDNNWYKNLSFLGFSSDCKTDNIVNNQCSRKISYIDKDGRLRKDFLIYDAFDKKLQSTGLLQWTNYYWPCIKNYLKNLCDLLQKEYPGFYKEYRQRYAPCLSHVLYDQR